MITNFEEETDRLNKIEKEVLLPLFVKALSKKIGKEKQVTSSQMIDGVWTNFKIKIEGSRVRKLINYIRNTGLIPGLIATNKGYYVSDDPRELQQYIKSLEEREAAIRAIRHKTTIYLSQLVNSKK